MKTETVHFSICPVWFTNLLRTLWMEHEYGKAFRIADAAFPEMTIEDKIYLVTGRKKLVYDDCPDAEEKSIFKLEGDDWKPSGAFASMKVPTVADVFEQSQLFENNREAFELMREVSVLAHSAKGIPSRKGAMTFTAKGSPKGWINARDVVELICRVFPQPTSEQWHDFWEKYGETVEDIQDEDGGGMIGMLTNLKTAEKDEAEKQKKLAAQWGPSTANNIDVFMAHDRELSNRSTPDPDYKLNAEDGWVLPDGKFYPCGYMEHIWLAGRLGKEEREAEKAGWIKISHGLSGELYIHKHVDSPTQKQINTVFDWCEKHKAKLPDWAGGKEE